MSDRVVKKILAICGSYVNQSKEKKNRYIEIGSLLRRDDGTEYVLLRAHVNLAAFNRPQGSDCITGYFRDPDGTPSSPSSPSTPTGGRKPIMDDLDDDIPF